MPMRKEVIFAIIFGVVLGGIILYGIRLANNSITSLNSAKPAPAAITNSNAPTASSSATTNVFQIISPQDHAVVTDTTLTLRGTAAANSNLSIVTENDDLILQASPEGTFSAQINLTSGENKITVTTPNADQTIHSISITVIRTDTLPE